MKLNFLQHSWSGSIIWWMFQNRMFLTLSETVWKIETQSTNKVEFTFFPQKCSSSTDSEQLSVSPFHLDQSVIMFSGCLHLHQKLTWGSTAHWDATLFIMQTFLQCVAPRTLLIQVRISAVVLCNLSTIVQIPLMLCWFVLASEELWAIIFQIRANCWRICRKVLQVKAQLWIKVWKNIQHCCLETTTVRILKKT